MYVKCGIFPVTHTATYNQNFALHQKFEVGGKLILDKVANPRYQGGKSSYTRGTETEK